MFNPVQTVAPVETPISVAEAKAQTVIDDTESDAVIEGYIAAAVAECDGWTGSLGRCIVTQTWSQSFRNWNRCMRLPFPDIQSAVVKYYDADDQEQTVDTGLYETLEDSRSGYIRFKSAFTFPTLNDDRTDRITITMIAGYGLASSVPADIKQALLMTVSYWYNNRDTASEKGKQDVPLGAKFLLSKHRRNRL